MRFQLPLTSLLSAAHGGRNISQTARFIIEWFFIDDSVTHVITIIMINYNLINGSIIARWSLFFISKNYTDCV